MRTSELSHMILAADFWLSEDTSMPPAIRTMHDSSPPLVAVGQGALLFRPSFWRMRFSALVGSLRLLKREPFSRQTQTVNGVRE